VFLNDDEFDDEFKKLTTALVSGKTHHERVAEEEPRLITAHMAVTLRTAVNDLLAVHLLFRSAS
jgi:hypothetical protein